MIFDVQKGEQLFDLVEPSIYDGSVVINICPNSSPFQLSLSMLLLLS